MSFGSKLPQKPMYEELADTPWITQGRDLSDKGYQGIVDNYNKVNVFDQDTQRNLDAQTNAIYNRAEQDYQRQYRDTMLKLQNANYGQFGTTNATPALYRTDMANLEAQRHLADSAYNKALYREQLINNELQRRYNTLNMFNEMYNRGEIPYQLDLQNWQIRNLNKDRQFQNAEIKANAGGGLTGAIKGAVSGGAQGFAIGGPIGAIVGAIAGGGLGSIPQYNSNGGGAFDIATITNLGNTLYSARGNQGPGTSSGSGNTLLSALSNLLGKGQGTTQAYSSGGVLPATISSYLNYPTTVNLGSSNSAISALPQLNYSSPISSALTSNNTNSALYGALLNSLGSGSAFNNFVI